MRLCVCMYVSMYVCQCMYLGMLLEPTFLSMFEKIHTCSYTYTHIHVSKNIPANTLNICIYIYTCIHLFTHLSFDTHNLI